MPLPFRGQSCKSCRLGCLVFWDGERFGERRAFGCWGCVRVSVASGACVYSLQRIRLPHFLPHWGSAMSGHPDKPSSSLPASQKQESSGTQGSAVRRQSLAADSDGHHFARGRGSMDESRAEFSALMLSIAPQSILDRAAQVVDGLVSRRTLMTADLALSVGCVLVYAMDVDSAIDFMASLNAETAERFVVALAHRVRSEVSRSAAAEGECLLPSPRASKCTPSERIGCAGGDLEHMTNELAMGDIEDVDRIFTTACEAVTTARNRFAACRAVYSPFQPSMASTPSGTGPGVASAAAIALKGAASFNKHTIEPVGLHQHTESTPRAQPASAGNAHAAHSQVPPAIAALNAMLQPVAAPGAALGEGPEASCTRPAPNAVVGESSLPATGAAAFAAPGLQFDELDALINQALGSALEAQPDVVNEAAEQQADMRLNQEYALHKTHFESALADLIHLDPEQNAAAAFAEMMCSLMTSDNFGQGISFLAYMDSWVACMRSEQHVLPHEFATICVDMFKALKPAECTSALVGEVPRLVARRVTQHAEARLRSRGSGGRRGAASSSAASFLGAACSDPTCCPEQSASRALEAAVSEQRMLIARERAALEQREQSLRQQQHEANFESGVIAARCFPCAPPGSTSPSARAQQAMPASPFVAGGVTTADARFDELAAAIHGATAAANAAAAAANAVIAGSPPSAGGGGPPGPPGSNNHSDGGGLPDPPDLPGPGDGPPRGSPELPPSMGRAVYPGTPTSMPASLLRASGEQAPLFHTEEVGGGRSGPTESLAAFVSIRDGTPVDTVALKAPLMTAQRLTGLMDVLEGDYDAWLSNRNAFIKLLDQGFVQARQIRIDRSTAMDAVRDVLKEAFAASGNMRALWRRVHKKLGTNPNTAETDCLLMLHEVDKHCIPIRRNAIKMDITQRSFRIGEESVTSYLRELYTMGLGHFTPAWLREHFMVQIETALNLAEKEGSFDISLINAARDEVIEKDQDLPKDLEELYDRLHKISSLRSIWASRSGVVGGASGGARKSARTFAGQGAQVSFEPPEPPSDSTAIATALASLTRGIEGLHAKSQASPPPPQQPSSAPPSPENATLAALAASLQTAVAANLFGKGGGKGWDGGKGRGGDGRGGGRARYQRMQYDLPAIIATGLIWPSSTVLTWDNAERKGCSDGTDDGLFGLKCPFCGHMRSVEMTFAAFKEANGGRGPGSRPGQVPCPTETVLVHRALECGIAARKVQDFLADHPEHARDEAFQPMTEERLAAFKRAGG